MIMGKWKVDVMYSLFDLHNHNLRSFLCHNDFSYDDTNLGTFSYHRYLLFIFVSIPELVSFNTYFNIHFLSSRVFIFIYSSFTYIAGKEAKNSSTSASNRKVL